MEDSELVQMAVDLVYERNYVSFVELQALWASHFDVKGDYAITLDTNENIVFWSGVSERFSRLFNLLEGHDKVKLAPTDYWAYLIDGCVLRLPLVKTRRNYKKPHWLPAVVCRRDGRR